MEEIKFQKPSCATESKWGDPTFDFFFQLKLVKRIILL